MLHKEYYATGEIKNEGTFLEIMDCTSRESGRNIESDDHKSCVECLDRPTFRKTGDWRYYNKSGTIIMTGSFTVLDYIGVPSVKNGIWSIFREDGRLLQQIVYNNGKVEDISFFDDENERIE